jgi:hypothetical protein
MSAWIVNDAHIEALVETAAHGPRDGERWRNGDTHLAPYRFQWFYGKNWHEFETWNGGRKLEDVGQMLLNENYRSVNYRYSDDTEPHTYTPKGYGYRLTLAECVQAIACLEYHSCERPDWKESEAYAFCLAFRRKVLEMIPGVAAAPWGISEDWLKAQAVAV